MDSEKCVVNSITNDKSDANLAPSSLPVKEGKKRPVTPSSFVWDHFTEIKGCDLGERRCKCNYCGKDCVCEPDDLWAHLNKQCEEYPYKLEVKRQKVISSDPQNLDTEVESLTGSNEVGFSRRVCQSTVTKMAILDELPFRLVEREGFKSLCCEEIPRFEPPSWMEIARDVLQLYLDEKKKLKSLLASNSKSVCLSIDTWKSLQNADYVCVTAHFIDDEWGLQKKILRFSQVPNRNGKTVGKVLEACILEWGIAKVLTITVGGKSDDEAIDYVKGKLLSRCVLDGEFLLMKCCTSVINMIVSESLRDLHDSIASICNVIKYVRSYSARLQKFKEHERESVESKGLPVLDMPTCWNSTFLMLEAATQFREAFEKLKEEDESNYFARYFMDVEGGIKRIGPPSLNDWDNASAFVTVSKIFYDANLNFTHVNSNACFLELCEIESSLIKWSQTEDSALGNMERSMKRKYDKYWGSVDSVNQLLFVSLVLDPRCKMEFVKLYFHDLFDGCLAAQMTQKINKTLKRLYKYYSLQGSGCTSQAPKQTLTSVDGEERPSLTRYKAWLKEKNRVVFKTEIDRYFSKPSENLDDDEFDVLGWWKLSSSNYPILSLIARDLFAIPVSTVASQCAFNIGDHTLDPFRSSLSPRLLEALICTQNWLRSMPVHRDSHTYIDDLKKYEEIESCKNLSSLSRVLAFLGFVLHCLTIFLHSAFWLCFLELLGPYTSMDHLQSD